MMRIEIIGAGKIGARSERFRPMPATRSRLARETRQRFSNSSRNSLPMQRNDSSRGGALRRSDPVCGALWCLAGYRKGKRPGIGGQGGN